MNYFPFDLFGNDPNMSIATNSMELLARNHQRLCMLFRATLAAVVYTVNIFGLGWPDVVVAKPVAHMFLFRMAGHYLMV